MKKVKRPVPLIFIMIFTAMISLTQLVGGIGPVSKGAPNLLVLYLALLYVLMGFGGWAAVIGLWMLQPWASLLTRIIYLISIPMGIFAMALDSRGINLLLQMANIGLDVWIVWYLTRPATKALFAGGRSNRG